MGASLLLQNPSDGPCGTHLLILLIDFFYLEEIPFHIVKPPNNTDNVFPKLPFPKPLSLVSPCLSLPSFLFCFTSKTGVMRRLFSSSSFWPTDSE